MTTKNPLNSYVYGIGRKKESRAIVYLVPVSESNSGKKFEVNGCDAEQYFQQNVTYLNDINLPLQKVDNVNEYSIIANVKGGGLTGQADSIKLGISRALCKIDKVRYRPTLKFEGFLTRDARIKERRKYGLKKARKASQYSKR